MFSKGDEEEDEEEEEEAGDRFPGDNRSSCTHV